MKSKINWITIVIIAVVVILAYIILTKDNSVSANDEIAKCIAENSIVYAQLGCHACETQKKLFGSSYKYINEIDCFYDSKTCNDAKISATPTWIINNQSYVGVQSIEKLQELTGCESVGNSTASTTNN